MHYKGDSWLALDAKLLRFALYPTHVTDDENVIDTVPVSEDCARNTIRRFALI